MTDPNDASRGKPYLDGVAGSGQDLESRSSEGSERREFRRNGKIVYIRDELTKATEFEYSPDGELMRGDATPPSAPRRTYPDPAREQEG